MILQNSKDIIIENDHVKYYFSHLVWDSNFFNRPSYYLNIELSHFCKSSNHIEDQIRSYFKDCFVTAKIDTSSDYDIIKTLQNSGFYYVETEIKLGYQKETSPPKVNNSKQYIEILELTKNQHIPYEELGSTFQNTRFHTDINIPKKRADDLWISYLKNYIPDDFHFIFVAKENDKIVGAILANKIKNEVFFCYVAVKQNYQGMGIGTKLIQHVIRHFNGFEITTGTQAKNIQALNYYIINNFSKIVSTKIVLHNW